MEYNVFLEIMGSACNDVHSSRVWAARCDFAAGPVPERFGGRPVGVKLFYVVVTKVGVFWCYSSACNVARAHWWRTSGWTCEPAGKFSRLVDKLLGRLFSTLRLLLYLGVSKVLFRESFLGGRGRGRVGFRSEGFRGQIEVDC